MNSKKWEKYIQKKEVIKTKHGMESSERSNDLNFIQKTVSFLGKKILDIGCEEGLVVEELNKKFGCNAVGLTLGSINNKTNFIKYGDMHELPFDDNSFDMIFIMHTLEHSIAPYIVLSEIKRVLKDNGEILIIMPEEGDIWTSVPQHYSTMTFRQLFNLLHKLKFIPVLNLRKEYFISHVESKRDIISVWKNTKKKETLLMEKQTFLIPVLGASYTCKNNTIITSVLSTEIEDKNINHFIGRTDSLKGG